MSAGGEPYLERPGALTSIDLVLETWLEFVIRRRLRQGIEEGSVKTFEEKYRPPTGRVSEDPRNRVQDGYTPNCAHLDDSKPVYEVVCLTLYMQKV